MERLTEEAIKSDYFGQMRENNELKARIRELEYEKSMLELQRSSIRKRRLDGMNAKQKYRITGFQAGLLLGSGAVALLFTLVVYAATH